MAPENFVACSGANISDVKYGSKSFGPQVNKKVLNAGVRVVVLSVTGDDIGFGNLGNCINIDYFGHGHPSTQAQCDQAVKQSLDSIPKALADLVKLWATIETMTHAAWIIQLGYPRVFPSGGYDGGCNGITQPKQNQLNNVADTLDSALQRMAAEYPYVKFVDTAPTFAGHEVCGSSGKPYINDLQTNVLTAHNCPTDYIVNNACSQSFHPNAWGYEAEAQLLKPIIAQLLATSSPSPSPVSTSACSSQTFLSVVRSKGYAQSVTPSGTPACAGGYAMETFVPYAGGQEAQFFFKKNPDGTWTIIEGGNATPTIACRVIPVSVLTKLRAQCPPAAYAQPSPPTPPSSISPGHATPKDAVEGFFQARFQGNETLACSYASPASRASCSSQNSQQPAINGNVALHDAVVSGKFALVEVTGSLCYPGLGCESNTNPLLGMPASPASFQQVYDDLVKSTTYTFSPYPCIRVGGMWYINFGP